MSLGMSVPPSPQASLFDRFWSKVDTSGDCWLWTAAVDRKGYGKIGEGGAGGRTLIASRVGYELQVGPIPEGMSVLHLCDTPACVRGDHLFLGTQKENLQDMVAKNRGWWSNRTHCPHGHEYTPENTLIYGVKKPQRVCKTCQRARDAARSWH